MTFFMFSVKVAQRNPSFYQLLTNFYLKKITAKTWSIGWFCQDEFVSFSRSVKSSRFQDQCKIKAPPQNFQIELA